MPIVNCNYCHKDVYKSPRRYNEGIKLGYKPFCNVKCLGKYNRTKIQFTCSRKGCKHKFFRRPSDFNSSQKYYCSHRCLALVVNSKRVLKPKPNCKICSKQIMRGRIFCSPKCHFVSQRYPSEVIIDKIKDFYNINQRIPLKSEFNHTSAAKKRFGTWNNAIIASGFEPNPIRFAKKYLANDGHKCDSLSEKIIDDWLSRRKIKHERSVLYITGKQFTADFVVGKYWIEFFGLAGELKRYDYLKMEKIKLARKLNLDLIGIYPKDLFPKGNLNEKLSMLI